MATSIYNSGSNYGSFCKLSFTLNTLAIAGHDLSQKFVSMMCNQETLHLFFFF